MDDELVSLVKRTLTVLDEAKVPAPLRPVAFEQVLEMLRGGSTVVDVRQARQPEQHKPFEAVSAGSDDRLSKIAAKLGLSRELAEQVYFVDSDEVELVVPHSKLDGAKARATEQIALLLAAGRQAAGIDAEGWTSVDPIREQCEHFKRYDQSNFATTVKDMHDVFTVRGSGRDRVVRMTAPGWNKAADLIEALLGQRT